MVMKLQLTFSDYLWSALFLLGMAVCFSEAGRAQAWSVTGNAGTNCTGSPCSNFIGTTDNSSFEIDVNGQRAFALNPWGFYSATSLEAIKAITWPPEPPGATIAGGGASWRHLNCNVAVNRVT